MFSLKTLHDWQLSNIVTGSHEGGSGDDGSRHVCIIAVFLLVRLLYLHIHSFRLSIQIYTDFYDTCKFHRSCCSAFINCLLFTEFVFETDSLTLMLTFKIDSFREISSFHYKATTVSTVQN